MWRRRSSSDRVTWMRLRRASVVWVAAALPALAAYGAVTTAIPPPPERWATDQVGVLSAGVRQTLDARLEGYQRATGHQVIVWIGQLPEGQAVEDWTARVFSAWGIGRKGHDDGVGVFFFPAARRMRIEVGYGLEGQLTDLASARIIREEVTPRLGQGDWDGAVTAAVGGVLGALGGEPGAPPPRAAGDEAPRSSLAQKIFLGIIVLFVLGILITHPSLAVYLLFSIFSGGGGGRGRSWGGGGGGFGGGGGGGGFSGGGGSSGGGGASGSW
jgi:uncharacterized protein